MTGIICKCTLSLFIAASAYNHISLLAQETACTLFSSIITTSNQVIILTELTFDIRCFVDRIRLGSADLGTII